MDVYDHCQVLVRERDRERYLSALFAPSDKRRRLYALYAYDLELAQVADAVREPMAGEVRFQWWREALAGMRSGEAAANPVSAALLDTIEKSSLRGEELVAIADARQFDVLGEPMSSMSQLLEYLDATHGTIMRAAAQLLSGATVAEEATRHAARTYGFTLLLRNIARDVSRGRLFLPLDILAEHEVHTAAVLAGENSAGLQGVLRELRTITRAELEQARSVQVPESMLPALLPLAIAPIYLARMDKRDYDPFRSDVVVSALRVQFDLWRAARSGTI